MTTISGSLPGGDGNGLNNIAIDLIETPHKLHVAICILDCQKITTNTDNGTVTPTARIRRIEVISETDDMKVAEGLMRRALDQRTGREALPYDLEQELRGVFDEATSKNVNPDTGEVKDDDKE